ncbi:hypothetical protein CHS0354_029826 [Potamilus streckersoni]|uniref:FAD dependent oxidoreductase domain-containing protein n=1 Tax=Potamilus streckersoni TaxID=2493646 RepID=A0AAE0RLX3_9BIVA|nr:hypothetical protein CHS0354_029826 [Potamilus streckersoni]
MMARESMEKEFDLCIVGAGMIGSAAARHASLVPGLRVCLFGPDEPMEKSLVERRDIFGAHYDEGRIARTAELDPVWGILSRNSIGRYRMIEKESGISFYKEVGAIQVGTPDNQFIKNTKQTISDLKVPSQEMNAQEMGEMFPYLTFAEDDVGLYQSTNCGHISPRKLVRAQQVIASNNGCTIIRDVVAHVRRIVQSNSIYMMEVVTEDGSVYKSKTVLITTGAFTTFRNLLPYSDVVPEIALYPLAVAKVEVSADYANKLRTMPCVSYRGRGGKNWYPGFPRNESDQSVSYYMLPPIKYPDGRYYIKLGHNHATLPRILRTSMEVKEWFCKGDQRLVNTTADLIISMFKGMEPLTVKGDFCVVVGTPTFFPYIDLVHSELGIATGGNGLGAKSSDEIGRIAVAMMTTGWDSEIPKEKFTLRLKRLNPTSRSTHSNL